MMRISGRSAKRTLLAVLSLVIVAPFASAQGMAGLGGAPSGGGGGLNSTGGGGGGGGGGGSGGSSSIGQQGGIGTSTPIGSGNLSVIGTGGVGLSSLTGSGTKTSTAAGNSSIPAQNDPFNSFFSNPYSTGLIGNPAGANTFGQPIYAASSPPVATPMMTSSITIYKPSTATGFTSVGLKKTPSYIATVSEDVPLVRHNPGRLRAEVQQIIARSATLKPGDNIQVEVLEGGIARLTGTVVSARDHRLAESIVRTVPGVQNVQNELQVNQQFSSSR